jgi:hypothetical protein
MTLYIEISTDEACDRMEDGDFIYIFTNGKYKAVCYVSTVNQHYKPLEVSDEFIKWDGVVFSPISDITKADIIYKDGACTSIDGIVDVASLLDWSDIIAYRVIKPSKIKLNKPTPLDIFVDKEQQQAPTQPDLISREKVIEIITKFHNLTITDYHTRKQVNRLIDKINQIKSEGNNE